MQRGRRQKEEPGPVDVQNRKAEEVVIPELKNYMGGLQIYHLLYLSLKVTILFAVYLEAWGACCWLGEKRRVSGENVVIRKGGLEAPERMEV